MGMLIALVVFIGTVLLVCITVIGTQQRGTSRITAIIIGSVWFTLTGILAATGWLRDFSTTPPRIAPLMLIAFAATLVFALGPQGRRTLTTTPITVLVALQSFRIAVEVVLLVLYHIGVVPIQMTAEGYNWDIATGVSAPMVAYLLMQRRLPHSVLFVWNSLGTLLLIAIVVISILSAPVPFRVFMNEPANTFITTLPFLWLPLFLVPIALWSHLLVFRHLFRMISAYHR